MSAEVPLRRWLSKQPHPALVVAEFSDGSEKRVRIGVSRSKFRDAEEALAGCVSAEALDAEGSVLRAWHASDDAVATEKKQGAPEVHMMVALANVLAQVSDQAVARYASIVSLSFEQNAKLLGLISSRLSAIEKMYHASLIAQAEALAAEEDARAEQAEKDENLPLVAQVLTQALGGSGNSMKEKD